MEVGNFREPGCLGSFKLKPQIKRVPLSIRMFEYLEKSLYALFFRKEILCQKIVRKKDVRERSEKEQDVKNDNLILKVYSAHGHAVQRCVFCNENSI